MVKFLSKLFENGFETYDRVKKQRVNLGGAQFWNSLRWKGDDSDIQFHNKSLREALFSLPLSCFTLSRADMDNGKPVYVLGTQSISRICQSVLFYPQLNNDKSAQIAYDRILDACPELEGYFDNLGNYSELLQNLNVVDDNGCIPITAAKIVDTMIGEEIPLNLDRCLLLAVPSGSNQSAQYWGNAPKSTSGQRTNRNAMRPQVTSSEETPF